MGFKALLQLVNFMTEGVNQGFNTKQFYMIFAHPPTQIVFLLQLSVVCSALEGIIIIIIIIYVFIIFVHLNCVP